MVNDKYFTTEMTDDQRKALLTILGLDALRYVYVESVGETFIRVDEIAGNESKALLPITSRLVLGKYLEEKSVPHIEFQSNDTGAVFEAVQKQPLWRTLFPFPLCKVGKQTKASPPSFETELFRLQDALNALELKMSPCEVGLVTFAGQSQEYHLLVHSVRGSRVRVGVPEDFDSFLSTFRGAAPTIADLEGYFGTSVSYVRIEVPQAITNSSILEALTTSINDAIPSVVFSARRGSEIMEPIQIQL